MRRNLLKQGFALLFTMLLVVGNSMAQNSSVTGTVVDENNAPVIGASVVISGTTVGVVTDADGNYSINASADDTLVISYLGYEDISAQVNSRTVIDVALVSDSEEIDELVVVGYGVQKKSHLSGSIASVDTQGLADAPIPSLDQMLVGKSAGLSITNQSGNAGDNATIQIRGMGSISNNSEPLVIVDGFQSSMEEVNPNDVESIEVLKDAASSAIYGSRAANGVILITTKSGVADKPQYSVQYSTGIKSYYKQDDWLSYGEFVEGNNRDVNAYNDWIASPEGVASGLAPKVLIDDSAGSMYRGNNFVWEAAGITTDWVAEATNKNAQYHSLQASVSGGSKDIRYYISGNYTHDEGVIKGNTFNKVNFRAKLDAKLSKRVDVGVSIAPQYTKKGNAVVPYKNIQDYSANQWMPVRHNQGTVDFITGYNPAFPKTVGDYVQGKDFGGMMVYDDAGNLIYSKSQIMNSSIISPVQKIENIESTTQRFSFSGNAYINVKIIDGLSFRSSNNVYVRYSPTEYFAKAGALSLGSQAEGHSDSKFTSRLLTENMFSYVKSFGKHDLNVLAGYTADLWKGKYSYMQGLFDSDYVTSLNAASELISTDTYTRSETVAMESYLARLMYGYDDKYLVSASWRADGSSKFGPDSRWGYFPSVSLAWRVTQEKWMKDVEWLNQLKIRASYGVTGSDNIDNYAPYNTLDLVQTVMGEGSGYLDTGYANTSSTLGNSALSWEETDEWNVGFDMSVLRSRLSLSVDLYSSQTKALLMEEAISGITGFDSYYNNVGVINNKGIELELSGLIIDKPNFKWNGSFNIFTNQNTLKSLGNGATEVYSQSGNYMFLAKVGEPSVQFWGYKTDGIYMTQADADADTGLIESKYLKAGNFRVESNGDGILDNDDRQVIGDPFPDFEWGMTHYMTYKNFDLSFVIQGVQGGEILNGNVSTVNNKKYDRDIAVEHWVADVDGLRGNGVNPQYNPQLASNKTSYAVEDASYAALRNLTLGYTLPAHITKKIGLRGVRFYASGQNLFYIWSKSFRGVNPEARSDMDNPLIQGFVESANPLLRTLSLGIDVNF